VDAVGGDQDGWEYSKTFNENEHGWGNTPVNAAMSGGVRRRRWIRVRKRKVIIDMMSGLNSDYLVSAKNLIQKVVYMSIKESTHAELEDALKRYEEAIEMFLKGVKGNFYDE